MTDVCNFATALVNNQRLIGGSALKVAVSDQLHVPFRLLIPTSRCRSNLDVTAVASGEAHHWDVGSIGRVALGHEEIEPCGEQQQRQQPKGPTASRIRCSHTALPRDVVRGAWQRACPGPRTLC